MSNLIESNLKASSDDRFGIIVSRFNEFVTEKLLDGCIQTLIKNGVDDKKMDIVKVPGAFEIPTVAKNLIDLNKYNAIICIGCVIKGETDHDQIIAYSTAIKLSGLSLKFEKPVSLGIIGPNVTKEQAFERVSHYGCHSVEALLKIKNEFKKYQ